MTARVAVFSAKPFEREALAAADARHKLGLAFLDAALSSATAASAAGCAAVSAFVNDTLDRPALAALHATGVRLVALRCAGYDHVDRAAAADFGVAVAHVPAYSPNAVAEHAVALLMALNRRIHLARDRVRAWDFRLDGLMGFDLHGRTVGVIGTGRIGAVFARIMAGFGCRLLVVDPVVNDEVARLGARSVALPELLREADVVSLHCPLTTETRHLIDAGALAAMKPGALLVNTGRGGLIDAAAALEALKTGRLGGLAIDVYEREAGVFFEDWSRRALQDDLLGRLLGFPNVLVTPHQSFFTREAVDAIAETTLANITAFLRDGAPLHPLPTR